MGRLLLNLLTALSLLLCGITAALWVRSHRRGDRVDFVWSRVEGGDHRCFRGDVTSLNGGIGLFVVRHALNAEDVQRYWPELMGNSVELRRAANDWGADYPPVSSIPQWSRAGFNFVRRYHQNPSPTPSGRPSYLSTFGFTLPYWFVAMIAAAPTAIRLVRHQRQRAAVKRKLCPRCGYDLRATPGRCPECGQAVPPPRPLPVGGSGRSERTTC